MKAIFHYLFLVGVPILGILGLLHLGQGLTAPPSPPPTELSATDHSLEAAIHLPTLLIQISVILLAARLVGMIFRKIHQPQVMGEMVAGILLGPSLLGWVAPNISAALFPPESLGFLNALSQVGLLLFMFLIGLELDPQLLKGRGHSAVVTSHVSIFAPFFLGTLLALYLYPRLSNSSVPFTSFALFVGIAMSITAFPVLARILTERNLLRTKLGSLTITCAAVDDVTGWCILAGVVLLVRAGENAMPLWLTVGGSAAYILAMIFIVRPLMSRLESIFEKRKNLSQNIMAFIFLAVLLSGLATEWLGIHALFGAFLAGVIMPKQHQFVVALTQKLEDVAVVLLLPLFFAFTGLRASIGLVSGLEMWFYCGLIILVAVVGKFGGSTLAARFTGTPWREAGALGILMNTRGLMELVVLNIGLDIGVLSPALFTMMVLMALITTFMTSPILEWIYFTRLRPSDYAPINLAATHYPDGRIIESPLPEMTELPKLIE
jgi:Kef-type K+ transport system membrane component KefB